MQRMWRSCHYTLELFWLMTLITLGLRQRGMKPIIARCTAVQSHNHRPSLSRHEETELVATVNRLARCVCRLYLVPTSCLHHALLPCWFLARRGIKVEIVIAVCKSPFTAHAWAKWGEVTLSDPPRFPELFVPLVRR